MEDHGAVNFMRLMSEESTHSSLSLDSCEYYQTEIFDQLPSIQASRPERNTETLWEPCRANQGGPEPGLSHLSKGTKDKASTRPLRNLALCIQAKRGARDRRKMQVTNIGYWESWRRGQSTSRRRVWAQMGGALSSLLPWQRTLHAIEGRFGVGVKSYFVFLRYLVWLNILHCLVIGGFIVGPTFYGSTDKIKALKFTSNDSVLDFFLGTGYLDRSPVFYRFYTRGYPNLLCLNTPLLYLGGILTIFFLSLIMVIHRTVVGYKHTWMLGKRYSMNVSFKIFCGWDFTIQDPTAATLKRNVIRNDLKLILEEQSFSLRAAQRTLGQRARLYLLRFFLNLLVLSLLGGAFYLIYFTTITKFVMEHQHWMVNLILEYLAPITLICVNLFLPLVFRRIASFEDYSLTAQVNATLMRSIFLELASLGIFLYHLFTTKQNEQCIENTFGREMYKLCFIKFLTSFCNTFLWDYPRKLLWEKNPSSFLARSLGKQRFLIPFNVLDLVSSQTVFWVGVYYCPLVPLIGTVTLIATFYIKKFTVLRCCVAEQRMFRASSSSVLFHFMLLLGLVMAAVTLAYNFLQLQGQGDENMSSCGPFGNGETVFNVTAACVDSLPPKAQTAVRYLASEAFALPLILTEVIILTWFVSRGRANQKAIERLKDMLVMSCSDKRFLVKQHTTMLRRQKNNHRVHAAASE